jgi:hypothetical protein
MKLNEKMGIPDNIINAAEDLKADIRLGLLNTNIDFDKPTLLTKSKVKIVDLEVDLPVFIEVQKHPKYYNHVYSMGFNFNPNEYYMKKNRLKSKSLSKDFRITIYVASSEYDGIDPFKIIEGISVETLAHELKHLYDNYMGTTDLSNVSKYVSYRPNFPLESVREFLFLLYYTSLEESLVRPTEFYVNLKEKEITKKTFKSYLKESEIIETLEKAENITLEKLIRNIQRDPLLDSFIDSMPTDYKSVGDKVDNVINLLYINLANIRIDSSYNFINDFLGKSKNFFDDRLEADVFLENLQKEMRRYEKNPKLFFEKLIKKVNFGSTKMKRKLYKIYDMIPESHNESKILDWNLFLELKGNSITFDKSKWSKD